MKLRNLLKTKLHRSSIDGVFIKEMPLDFIKEMQAAIPEGDDPTLSDELVFKVFDAVVRDEEGNKIEDLTSPADVGELSIVVIRTIFDDMAKIMSGENTTGKP